MNLVNFNNNGSIKDLAIDASNLYQGTALELCGAKEIALYVVDKGGSHLAHEVTIEVSPDGITWFPTLHKIVGIGYKDEIRIIAKEVRASITVKELAASTIDIFLFSK